MTVIARPCDSLHALPSRDASAPTCDSYAYACTLLLEYASNRSNALRDRAGDSGGM
jgi:hypothetical protein